MVKVSKNLIKGREIKNPLELKKPKSPSIAQLKSDGTYNVIPVAFAIGFPLHMFFFNQYYWTKKHNG
jgi:hypothetical protein